MKKSARLFGEGICRRYSQPYKIDSHSSINSRTTKSKNKMEVETDENPY